MARGRAVSDHTDLFWMRRALSEAERGRGRVEPNPMVGAVVVRDGMLVGVGHHDRFGGPHAEVVALADAGEAARGATVYVTLEPCCHHGKTPPCTDALLAAGVGRVVAAMTDPFLRVAGGGLARLRESGVPVEVGPGGDAARRLNAPYLKRLATGRPYVTAKWAMTLDGKIATASGDSFWITSPRARALAHEVRGRMDAVVVGIGTALADDPQLTARPPGPRVAARVVLDSAARLPLKSRLVQTAREAPVLVAVTERAAPETRDALTAAGCEVIAFPGSGPVPVDDLLAALGGRGFTNILVEGGSRVLGAFFDAGEVDEVDVYIAFAVAGGERDVSPVQGVGLERMAEALRLTQIEVSRVGPDVRLRGLASPRARP
jgi:diaminohydroxyphosphoribosylaminopyrimidine deaminase/5-amino-6-(5-phosphoribosylamino)uracil reductase